MFDYTRITVVPPEGWNTLQAFLEASFEYGGFEKDMQLILAKAAIDQQRLINQLDDHYINIAEFKQRMKAVTNAGE